VARNADSRVDFDSADGAYMRSAQSRPENQASSYPDPSPTPTSSSSKSSPRQGSRTIVGLMFFAVSFSLVGNELKDKAGNPITTGSKIILGGIAATAILTLISHAGDTGNELAVGLALVTTASSVLVFGGPVWDRANTLFGSKPSTPAGATTATTPTQGTATAVALTKAA
jgi:hypothetical protein